jgi:hypothetical protein
VQSVHAGDQVERVWWLPVGDRCADQVRYGTGWWEWVEEVDEVDPDDGDLVAQPQNGEAFGGLSQGSAGAAAQVQPRDLAAARRYRRAAVPR